MNFDDIQQTWQSPHNRPSGLELNQMKTNLVNELRRQRRQSLGLLVLTLCPLLFFTVKVVLHLQEPQPHTTPVNLSREWGILPFFILPWVGWGLLAWRQRRHAARHPSYENSVVSSVTALLDQHRANRFRHRVVTVLLAVSVPILFLIVYQLRNVGKAGDEILIPALVLYPLYALGMICWLRWEDARKGRPRQHQLESLLREYQQPPHLA